MSRLGKADTSQWETEEPGDSVVRFGPDKEYTEAIAIEDCVTLHHVEIPISKPDVSTEGLRKRIRKLEKRLAAVEHERDAAQEGAQRARQLDAFFADARAAGELRGTRWALRWTRRALVRAGKMLQRERFRAGCHKLELVDWLLAPCHRWLFVRGPAAADLAHRVGTPREALDCDDRHFDRDPGARPR